jgi:NAD(P)-dependent dehydrogenase (short-subunit alcohol dehydrogenase family)
MSAAPELQGLRALVTGGTKGVGKAVVAHLCEAGANVLATARSRFDDLSEERFIGADITTAEGCKTIVDAVLEGDLDGNVEHPFLTDSTSSTNVLYSADLEILNGSFPAVCVSAY